LSIEIKDFPLEEVNGTTYAQKVIDGFCVEIGPGCKACRDILNAKNCPRTNGRKQQIVYE